MENEAQQINIEVKPEIAQGSYSNLAIITHSKSEFIIDFASILPGMPKPQVSNRLIMTPEHAKRLLIALQDNLIKFENQFGVIDLNNPQQQNGGTFHIDDFTPFNNGPKS